MEDINFSALAPKYGSRPLLSEWSDIGTSSMNGGAFNWGGLWSGLKNFGSSIYSLGTRAWNSNTGQMLRQQLKDTNLQDKLVQGIATGIHGAVDLANQEIQRAVQKRLESRPVPDALVEEVRLPAEEMIVEQPSPGSSVGATVESVSKKRPSDTEELVIRSEAPPSYDDLYPNTPSPASVTSAPTAVPPAAPVVIPQRRPASVARPSRQSRGWQGTLNSIVGLGVRSVKRRRCF